MNLDEDAELEFIKGIWFRGQNADGRWAAICVADATDEQFDKWIKSRVEVPGGTVPWSMHERAVVCQALFYEGSLYTIRPEGSQN